MWCSERSRGPRAATKGVPSGGGTEKGRPIDMQPVLAEIIGPDLLIVLAVVALLFGGSQIPKLARSLGAARAEFEKGFKHGDDDTKKADKADSSGESATS